MTKLNAAGTAVVFSTYLGTSAYDEANGIAVDASGNVYVTGRTASTNFPTTAGAFQTIYGGGSHDGFVTKLNAAGSALVYSTFLGGSNQDNGGHGMGLDASGNAYVTETTYSADFPTTAGAFQTSYSGSSSDVTVTKLNAAGTALVYSTYLGGNSAESSYGIAVDASGYVYVTGQTNSSNFPTTAGAFQTIYGGSPLNDGFVTKLNATGSALVYSTYLGGSGGESGGGVAVDGSGNVFVSGRTESTNFPTTAGAFDTTANGDYDAFVTKLVIGGFSTYLGGGGDDVGNDLAVDTAGNSYVVGYTSSSSFPTTAGAWDRTHNGSDDVFVAKLSPNGTLAWATYLGGSGPDYGRGIAVDDGGNVYVTGLTSSANFPTTAGAFDQTANGSYDAFVASLNGTTGALVYSTYLGGSGDEDQGQDIGVDGAGSVYVTGQTNSTNWPTTAGAFDTTWNGGFADAFVAKLDAAGSALLYSTYLGGSGPEPDYCLGIAIDPSGNAYLTGVTGSTDFPTTSGALQIGHGGGRFDAFVTKLDAVGSAGLVYSTYLGGSADYDYGQGIAVDAGGDAYTTGWTISADFPTTNGALQTVRNGPSDAYVTRLNATGSALAYSTYLGGSSHDGSWGGVGVDGSGRVSVTGWTESADFPTTAGAAQSGYSGSRDAFVTRLNTTSVALAYSTYLGGSAYDFGHGLAVDGFGNAFVTGETTSTDFPTTAGAFDTTANGQGDAFVTQLGIGSDREPDSVTIEQAVGQADPTAGSSISFDVVFPEPVTGFEAADVDLSASTVGGTLVPEVIGSGSSYTVSVTGMTGFGTVVASIPAGAAVNESGIETPASTSIDNTVTFDGVAPTVTVEQAAGQADPTAVGPITFTVHYSEVVTGFDGSDVSFAGSTVGGALVAGVTGSGTDYTVTVTGMTGQGTVVASVPVGAAADAAGNGSTASTGADNTVTFDNEAAAVTIDQAVGQDDPTSRTTITFDVEFSETVNGFDASDIDLSASTAGGSLVPVVTQTGPTSYRVDVTGMTTRGSVVASIPADAASDLTGNPSDASTSTDNSVLFLNAGVLSFTSAATVDTTEGAVLRLTVSRVGGSEGDITVDYATAVGTAVAADFTAQGGTFLWLEGETHDQFIDIPITNDTFNEGRERFTATLSNPTGGAQLGPLATTTATILPSDGKLIQSTDKVPSAVFPEDDVATADLVTVKLTGKPLVGQPTPKATVYITDPDGDGAGQIEWIELADTEPARTSLTISVKKPRFATGDGRAKVAEVSGTGLKAFTALTTDLEGTAVIPGIHLSGFLSTLKIGNVSGEADITMGAPPATIKRPSARITAVIIGNGSNITVAGAPLGNLTAVSVGDGTITAPSVGVINARGKAKTRLAVAIPGDFSADVVVSGIGVDPVKNAVTRLRAAGNMNGSTVTVTGNLGAIVVGGKADGVTIDVTGNVKSATFGQFWNSRLDAGYTGPSNGSGTFDFDSVVGTFKVTSRTNGFIRSNVVAANFKNVTLASVDPTVTGTKFGFAYHTSLRARSVRAPAFRFDPAGAAVQELASSDFEVRKA